MTSKNVVDINFKNEVLNDLYVFLIDILSTLTEITVTMAGITVHISSL